MLGSRYQSNPWFHLAMSGFIAVGAAYEDFRQLTDDEVIAILAEHSS